MDPRSNACLDQQSDSAHNHKSWQASRQLVVQNSNQYELHLDSQPHIRLNSAAVEAVLLLAHIQCSYRFASVHRLWFYELWKPLHDLDLKWSIIKRIVSHSRTVTVVLVSSWTQFAQPPDALAKDRCVSCAALILLKDETTELKYRGKCVYFGSRKAPGGCRPETKERNQLRMINCNDNLQEK